MMAIGVIQTGIVFFMLSLFITSQVLFDAFYMEYTSVHAGLIFFGMLYAPIDLFVGLFLQYFSRKNEYEADRFAATTTGNPNAMSESLKKLSVRNLSNLTPHPLYVFLNYSHPPVLESLCVSLRSISLLFSVSSARLRLESASSNSRISCSSCSYVGFSGIVITYVWS